ncbi:MAG: helix-turn-helix transcriptional regulator [Chlorobi bacterium]|nr:helix-turn-helix transcriptional regulator [Chlorobiota bacterium]
MSYIGKNIRKIRISKNLTQTEFAELFNLKRTAVGSYEEGRAEPKINTIIKISDYFNISLDKLLRKELTVNEIFHFRDDLLK